MQKSHFRSSDFSFGVLNSTIPLTTIVLPLHVIFEVDLATKFAQEGFVQEDPRGVFFALDAGFSVSFAIVGETGRSGIAACRGAAGVGLPGEALLIVLDELTELKESFVLALACEKMECVELTSVLELLPGSLFMAGRIGVDGLMGSGKPLVRRRI